MRIALVGSSGMLGSKMLETAEKMSIEVVAVDHVALDITREDQVLEFFQTQQFDGLVNCAGWTKVDDCEEAESFQKALAVNGKALGYLAKSCADTGRWLLHFSTDYVFDGQKQGAYLETDQPVPVNAYGMTKWEGEKRIAAASPGFYIVRTSWLYGPKGSHFVKTILGLLRTKSKIQVVNDQVGSPTYTGDLAEFALELVKSKAPSGIYHFANAGTASWYDFAKEIQVLSGLTDCVIEPVSSDNYPRKAKRPTNSRFDLTKSSQAVGHGFRPWAEALKYYLTKELA